MIGDDRHRSPRAVRNARQARITRLILGFLVLGVMAGAGYGVSWLRKRRGFAPASGPGTSTAFAPASQPAATDTAPASSRATSRRDFPTRAAIASLRERHADDSSQARWAHAQELRALAAAWQAEGAPEDDRNELLAAAVDVEHALLAKDPSFAPLRALRGEVLWRELRDGYDDFDERFFTKAEAARLLAALKQLDRAAARNDGWIARSEWEAVAKPLGVRAAEARAQWNELMKTRLGKAARAVEIEDLADLRTLLPTTRFRPWYHLPFVMLVEQDAGWEESEAALPIARTLLGLRRAFFGLYGDALGIRPDDQRAVPVVLFKTREGYHRYLALRRQRDVLGTEAHFEPKDERLVLHAQCAVSTILHEGTHQLVRANVRAPLDTYAQSLWFHEGIAEWFAGSVQTGEDPDGVPRYEAGLLLLPDVEPGQFLGPLAILRGAAPSERVPLATLAGIMLESRDKLAAQGADGARKIRHLYAEGWFLIYFLNRFNADAEGRVDLGAPGKYRDLWVRYLRGEIRGASGRKAFMDALTDAGVPLERLERERELWLAFVLRKIEKGDLDGQKLRPAAAPDVDRL
jgi:hypothetical protein